MEKVLVTGANGQLGSELRTLTTGNTNFFFTDIPDLDICDREAVDSYIQTHGITRIINCAAYTDVNRAESDEETAFKVNCTGAKTLAEAAAAHDILLIHISTDYVFDGRKNTPYFEAERVNPRTAYGRTKRAGEMAIQRSGAKSIIIRTAWLYSSFGKNFVKTILRKSQEGEINVVDDQFGTPTYARDLAQAILHILPQLDGKPRYGEIFHYTDEGKCSWAEFASKIIQLKHIDCIVSPITTDMFPTPAERPQYSVLDKTLIRSVFGVDTPAWERSLAKMLRLVNSDGEQI